VFGFGLELLAVLAPDEFGRRKLGGVLGDATEHGRVDVRAVVFRLVGRAAGRAENRMHRIVVISSGQSA